MFQVKRVLFVAFALMAVPSVCNAQSLDFSASWEDGATISLIAPMPISQISMHVQMSLGGSDMFRLSASFTTAESLKVLPKNKVKKIDAHQLKEDFVGKADVSKFDIYWDTDEKDTDKRKIILVKKSDTTVTTDTGLTWEDVLEDYPKDDKSLDVQEGSTAQF